MLCIDTTLRLKVFSPTYTHIDLRCATMPDTSETNVTLCAEAAFTHELLDTFSHTNIDGNHVSQGQWHQGATCIETPDRVGNTGAFVWYDGQYEFLYGEEASETALLRAAQHGGMGFRQEMVVHNHQYLNPTRATCTKYNRVETYRVLAQKADRLLIIESLEPTTFTDFASRLMTMNVDHAIYMDMGAGWNHSWYRTADGTVHEIHPADTKSRYCTNWITFYR